MREFLRLISIVIVLTVSGLSSFSCRKIDPEPEVKSYGLTVFVTDESAVPVQNALVAVDRIEKRTDAAGKCSFSDLSAGTVVLQVSADGYLPATQPVTLTGQAGQTVKVPLTKEPPFLSVDVEQIDTPEMVSKKTLHIQSNTAWHIESTSDELSFEPREGSGSQAVTVSWSFPEEQEDEDLALAEFTILSSLDPVTIPVRCHLPIRVVNVEGTVPNLVVDIKAAAIGRVTFSRKVVPVDAWDDAYTEYELRPVDDYTLDIVIPSFRLGLDYPIKVRAESASGDGVSFDETVTVGFFDGEVEVEGVFNAWSLTKDETRIWVSTEFPNRIYELDARSFSVLHSFDLDWAPGKLQLNPYNGRLYVVDNTNGVLKVLDPESGKLLKTITREPDELDHPQGPNTIAYNILFADNGFGVLVMTSIDDTFRWFFIDSRNDDALEQNPLEKEFGLEHDYWFSEMSLDHSRTKLVGGPLTYLNQCFHIIDSNTKTVTHYEVDNSFGTPGLENAGGVILQRRLHKEKDLMLFCAPYSAVVYDYVHDKYTYPLIEETLDEVFDFCYGDVAGNDICTYTFNCKGRFMEVYDHSTRTFLFATYFGCYGLFSQDLIPFREGDRITVISTNGNGSTFFTTFNTSRFLPAD